MKIILLSSGLLMVIDDIDYDHLQQWSWSASRSRHTSYAVRTVSLGCHQFVHVEIVQRMGIYDPDLETDHRDGCGLNNQRGNLQMLTHRENIWKSRIPRTNTSGVKGVSFDKSRDKWKAYIKCDGRLVSQKRFDTFEEAVIARAAMEVEYRPGKETVQA